jgi:hypothetical protein
VRITPIAAASLIPATIAGVAFTIMPFAAGTPAAAATRAHARTAVHSTSHVRAASQPAHVTAQASARPEVTQSAPAAQAAPQQPAAPVMSAAEASFEKCVAWRESGDNPTASSAGMFGILPPIWAQLGYSGTAGQAPVAQQVVAFDRLYQQYGTHPWAPYDGC